MAAGGDSRITSRQDYDNIRTGYQLGDPKVVAVYVGQLSLNPTILRDCDSTTSSSSTITLLPGSTFGVILSPSNNSRILSSSATAFWEIATSSGYMSHHGGSVAAALGQISTVSLFFIRPTTQIYLRACS